MKSKDENAGKFEREFEKGFFRSKVMSVFWSAFEAKKAREGFKLSDLADRIGANKSQVSRWFSGDPNWTLNTMADIAWALDIDLDVRARDRSTGDIYSEVGGVSAAPTSAADGQRVIVFRHTESGAEISSDGPHTETVGHSISVQSVRVQ